TAGTLFAVAPLFADDAPPLALLSCVATTLHRSTDCDGEGYGHHDTECGPHTEEQAQQQRATTDDEYADREGRRVVVLPRYHF
ncbi:hypothetical protein N4G69_43360, partial [Streptomyces mirabilis]|uniref:hypothetical protein n=1 Tax=Streptomyces mirabilis TaxID=68239 RepID=UPI0021C21DFF